MDLLQCFNPEAAKIIGRERRGFKEIVDLVEKLFDVYSAKDSDRVELRDVETIAKISYEDSNKMIHSIWFAPKEQTSMPSARRYNVAKNIKAIDVELSKLHDLLGKFHESTDKILELSTRYFRE